MNSLRLVSGFFAALAVIALAAPHAHAGIFAQAAPSTPEPSSIILLSLGALSATGYAIYQRRKAR
jgi:hypothetical protein